MYIKSELTAVLQAKCWQALLTTVCLVRVERTLSTAYQNNIKYLRLLWGLYLLIWNFRHIILTQHSEPPMANVKRFDTCRFRNRIIVPFLARKRTKRCCYLTVWWTECPTRAFKIIIKVDIVKYLPLRIKDALIYIYIYLLCFYVVFKYIPTN